jgi:anti-sigma28 factor (negative regulator of flagellin synthesis)
MATVKLRNTPTKQNKMGRPQHNFVKTNDSEIFQEKFEEIKNEIRSGRSKKDRQHNG